MSNNATAPTSFANLTERERKKIKDIYLFGLTHSNAYLSITPPFVFQVTPELGARCAQAAAGNLR